MAEKTLIKRKGDLPVVLFRPSIIASALEQPFPGWTDSLAAAGGITLVSGLGLVNYINTTGKSEFDLIPVDFVANGIIIATAKQGISKSTNIEIYNCATSSTNPLTLLEYKNCVEDTCGYFSFNKKVFRVKVNFEGDKKVF